MKRIISIMVIENDMTELAEIKRMLDKRNIFHRITVTVSLTSALHTLEQHINRPDIILIDLGVPGFEGMEFVRVVRNNPDWKNIKIFVLTTFETSVDKKTALTLGVSGFISKPLNLENPSSMDAYNLMIDLMNL